MLLRGLNALPAFCLGGVPRRGPFRPGLQAEFQKTGIPGMSVFDERVPCLSSIIPISVTQAMPWR